MGEEAYRIFLVEDDEALKRELSITLEKNGYGVTTVQAWDAALAEIMAAQPHLLLLDLTLPEVDGHVLCRQVRERTDDIPIIILTSRASELDELMSMNLGADDFITKPCNPQILLARIARLLTRAYGSTATALLAHNGVTLDVNRYVVSGHEGTRELTKNEFRILHLLMRRKGQIVSREEIMTELWESDAFVDDNTLTVNINRLRKVLEGIGAHEYLLTKRGLGYQV